MRFLYPMGQLCPKFTLLLLQIYHNSVLIKQALSKYFLTNTYTWVNILQSLRFSAHNISFITYSRPSLAALACLLVKVLINRAASLFTPKKMSKRSSSLMILVCILVIVSYSKKAKAQQALEIGDTIPQALWDLKLQTVNHPEGKNTITLNEYKGKLIILDFWSSYCGACIKLLPKAADLQAAYQEQIKVVQITPEPTERIVKVLNHNPNLKDMNISTVVADSLLPDYFPHRYFPHIVWINGDGVLLGATQAEYLNEHTIQQILEEKRPQWHLKNDQELFDPKQQSVHDYVKLPQEQVFLPYIPGMPHRAGKVPEGDLEREYVVNTSWISLYARALGKGELVFEPKRRDLQVADTARLVFNGAGYYEDWKQQNGISYEQWFPKSTDESHRSKLLLQQLNTRSGYHGRIEEQEIPVLLLTKTAEATGLKAIQKPTTRLMSMVANLNRITGIPWVVNESGLSATTLLYFPGQPATLSEVIPLLRQQGLQLSPATRRLPVFILTENYPSKTIPSP